MGNLEQLRREIDGEDGTFLILLRTELRWDWSAFYQLTSVMYAVADETNKHDSVDKYIAQGYWFIDTWVKNWTGQEEFPRPEKHRYEEALELLHDLSYFFFIGESPYKNETLREFAVRDT